MNEIVLRCSCCGLPWAKVRDGYLEVQSRHNGNVHVNRIGVSTLVEVILFREREELRNADCGLRIEEGSDGND